jgi:hypothetical protein
MRSVPVLFAFTEGDVWRLGIGDPTIMGWVTVVAYFGVAVLCFRRARDARRESQRRSETIFWNVLSALLVLLGINKQLDLQTWFTLTGRHIALSEGWYEYRRPVQFAFIAFIVLLAIGASAFMWRLVRAQCRELWLALLGFVLLLTFVIVRAASFHHVDVLINLDLAGVRMNWILELGAIAVIALGSLQKRSCFDSDLDSPAKAALS